MFVVGVHGPAELLSGIAHAVGTVVGSACVGGDTVADTIVAAKVAEEVTELVFSDVVGDTGEGVEHAFAEFLVGCRWEVRGSLPVIVDCWAGSSSGIGRVVLGRVGACWTHGGDLGGEVVEVVESRD